MDPFISIIIPVKNEAENLKICLDSIFAQELDKSFEIIVIDSGSTDGTLDIIKDHDVRLRSIMPEEFGHGKTRQLGVSLAKGAFAVFTVADAEPADNKWLSKLLEPLLNDKSIAASYGVQLVKPGPEHNPVARAMQLTQLNRPAEQVLKDKTSYDELLPDEQRAICNFDDCTSCIRTDILKTIPLPDVNYAEDFLWCRNAIQEGHKIAFVSDAAVYHYHKQSFRYVFKRYCYDQILSEKVFNLHYCDTVLRLMAMLLYSAKEQYRILREEDIGLLAKTRWFFYNMKVEFGRNLGYFIGSLGASKYEKRHKILRKLTEKTRKKVVDSMEGKAIIHD